MSASEHDRSDPAATDWMVVATHASREAYATENLERQGFVVYTPRIQRQIRHARRTSLAARPLFPSYIFVSETSARDNWRRLMSTHGVRTLLRSGDRPSLVSGDFVRALRAREVDGLLPEVVTSLRVGQEVRVEGGAFDGVVGTILELRENQRVVVLMNLLNQKSKVFVRASSLASV